MISLAILAWILVASYAPAVSVAAGEYNVRDFGAKGNGTTLDTMSIQKAVDACVQAGGGTVHFPAGVYLSQPLHLGSRTTWQIDPGATIKATDDPQDYLPPDVSWDEILSGAKRGPFLSFISGKDLTDVTLCGGGTIDGSGARWWVPAEAARQRQAGYTLPRPNLISFTRVQHLEVSGVTLLNSPKFHLVPDECEDVLIKDVTIRAPEHAANTDAIDPSACDNVMITNCTLDVGDDDVAIKAGRRVSGRDFASQNITVTGCIFLHGHGMSIGSETAGGVRQVTVENCTFRDTENGLRIKSDVKRGGLVEDIVYRNISMMNVSPAITFTCYYMNNSASDNPSAGKGSVTGEAGDKMPMYRHIRVSNVWATCPRGAGMILGLAGNSTENSISDVQFDDVHIASETGLVVQNAGGVRFKDSSILAEQGEAVMANHAEVTGLASGK